MLIYRVTVRIKPELAREFADWMISTHVPDVLNTGCFRSARFCKLNEETSPPESTFIIQYDCASQDHLDRYFKNFVPMMRKEFSDRYGDKSVLSRSVMEVMKEIHPHS